MELKYNIPPNMSDPNDCHNHQTIEQGLNRSLSLELLRNPNTNCSKQQLFRPMLPIGTKYETTPTLSFEEEVQVNFADQFKWGAIICSGILILMFICIIRCWCSAKQNRQQEAHNRLRSVVSQTSRQSANRPYYIESDSHGSSNVTLDIQQPPSYVEVISCFDPPPSYNDAIRVGALISHPHREPNQVYNNVGVTIDDLPPPFVEGGNKSIGKVATSQQKQMP